jgi:hypothetical protein
MVRHLVLLYKVFFLLEVLNAQEQVEELLIHVPVPRSILLNVRVNLPNAEELAALVAQRLYRYAHQD